MSIELKTLDNYYGTSGTTIILGTRSPSQKGLPGCLSVIGSLGVAETITIELPTTPTPDKDEDDHWQTFQQDGEAVALTATNLATAIIVGLTVRITIPVTASPVGVAWS